jgi:iron complex outermembrane receptor protein
LAWSGERAVAPLAISLYALQQRDRFSDPRGELTGLRQDNDDRTTRLGFTTEARVGLPMNQKLALLAEGRRERYTPKLMLPAPRRLPTSSRDVVAWGVEDQWLAGSGRVALVGTLRRQATFDEFPGGPPYPGALPVLGASRTTHLTSWTAGTRWDLGWGFSIKGTVSRLARMPTLEELFGNRGGIYGNPRLKPELVRTHDAGVVLLHRWSASSRLLPSWLESQLSTYRSDAQDLVIFIQNSQRSSVAQNISAARLDGLEASLRAAWTAGFSCEAAWTRQWSRDEGEVAYWRGKELPGRPRDEISAQVSLARRRWRTFYEFHFVAGNYLDRYNQTRAPARRLHNVGLAVSPWRGAMEWTAECRNLTDQHVEDYSGYPLPGRLFYVGARLRIFQEAHTHD